MYGNSTANHKNQDSATRCKHGNVLVVTDEWLAMFGFLGKAGAEDQISWREFL